MGALVLSAVLDHRKKRPLSAMEIHEAVLKGFSTRQVGFVAKKYGISSDEMARRCGMSKSTYHRQMHLPGHRLSPPIADLLVRYAQLLDRASEVFENEVAAKSWLVTEQTGLGGAIPIDFARTSNGFIEVCKLLTRVDQGVYA